MGAVSLRRDRQKFRRSSLGSSGSERWESNHVRTDGQCVPLARNSSRARRQAGARCCASHGANSRRVGAAGFPRNGTATQCRRDSGEIATRIHASTRVTGHHGQACVGAERYRKGGCLHRLRRAGKYCSPSRGRSAIYSPRSSCR